MVGKFFNLEFLFLILYLVKCFLDQTSGTCGERPWIPINMKWRSSSHPSWFPEWTAAELGNKLSFLGIWSDLSSMDVQEPKTPPQTERNPNAFLKSRHMWADPKVDGVEPAFVPSCTYNDWARPWELFGHNSSPITPASIQPFPYHQLEDAFPTHKHQSGFISYPQRFALHMQLHINLTTFTNN